MTRFLKGTTDHDSDVHMDGSNKGDVTMAKATKAARKTPEQAQDRAEKKAVAEAQFAEADAKGNPALDEVAAGVAVRGY